MVKGLLMDLGNTIVYNMNFDFNKGLKRIYDLACHPQISIEEFLEFNNYLKTKSYDNRGNIEIKLIDYISFIKSYFDLYFNLSLTELEIEFVKAAEEIKLISEVKKVLEYAKGNNIKVVILSNLTFSKNAIVEQLKPLNILHLIDELLISSECLFRKPEKLFFDLGIKTINENIENILYIGNDYKFDIIGAKNAGLKIGWFNEHHLPNHLNIDCFEFDNYKKLLHYLEGVS